MKHKDHFIVIAYTILAPKSYGFVAKTHYWRTATVSPHRSGVIHRLFLGNNHAPPPEQQIDIVGGGKLSELTNKRGHLGSIEDERMATQRRAIFSWVSSSIAVSTLLWPQLAKAIENINEATSVDIITQRKEMNENRSLIVKGGGTLMQINDVYPALVYTPPTTLKPPGTQFPVLVVLHGAGQNDLDVWNLANVRGEHSGLLPSLISSGMAPQVVLENFIVVAPYSVGKRSFYEEPRGKLLQCIQSITDVINETLPVDRDKLYLFGFSDGATLGVELMTTRRFAAGIFAAYGFTGALPQLALERLKGNPMWIFHSADDVIFPVRCSDRLVKDLRKVNDGRDTNIIKYSRFDHDQEGFTGAVRGHSTGITASKNSDIYKWLLSL